MPISQIFLLAEKKFPPSMHQFLDDIFKQEDFAKWHLLLFLWYILIFCARKCWFIELNLWLGSAAVWLANCLATPSLNDDYYIKNVHEWTHIPRFTYIPSVFELAKKKIFWGKISEKSDFLSHLGVFQLNFSKNVPFFTR